MPARDCIDRSFETGPQPLNLPVRIMVDATVAGAAATRFARMAGFDRRSCAQIAIAASELATNVVLHAHGSGELRLEFAAGVLEIVSLDRGPGDVEAVLTSMRRDPRARPFTPLKLPLTGLGCGLGAVGRMMNEVSVAARTGGGLRISARRRLGSAAGDT